MRFATAILFAVALVCSLPACANLSAERNADDAKHAAHVLVTDCPERAERTQAVDELARTAGSATQEAVAAMDGAAEYWQVNRRDDVNTHVITARERFWKEARATARQAFEHR